MLCSRVKYLSHIVARLIEHSLVFKGLTHLELMSFLSNFQQHAFREGELIFRQGETVRSMYVILRGSIEILQDTGVNLDDQKGLLGPGQCFGQMMLADAVPASATAVARKDSVLFILSEDALARTERMARRIYTNLATLLSNRCSELEASLNTYLGPECCQAECFKRLTSSSLNGTEPINEIVMAGMKPVGRVQTVSSGLDVVSDETVEQPLFVVSDGEFDVALSDRFIPRRYAKFKRGQCFGEAGFLNGGLSRIEGVRAGKDSTLFCVVASELQKSPRVATGIYRHLAKKLAIRLRGLRDVYSQSVLVNCQSDCSR